MVVNKQTLDRVIRHLFLIHPTLKEIDVYIQEKLYIDDPLITQDHLQDFYSSYIQPCSYLNSQYNQYREQDKENEPPPLTAPIAKSRVLSSVPSTRPVSIQPPPATRLETIGWYTSHRHRSKMPILYDVDRQRVSCNNKCDVYVIRLEFKDVCLNYPGVKKQWIPKEPFVVNQTDLDAFIQSPYLLFPLGTNPWTINIKNTERNLIIKVINAKDQAWMKQFIQSQPASKQHPPAFILSTISHKTQ